MTTAELRERCFELCRMQNNQNGSHRGGFTVPFRLLRCTTVFFLTMLVKKWHPSKTPTPIPRPPPPTKKEVSGYGTALLLEK